MEARRAEIQARRYEFNSLRDSERDKNLDDIFVWGINDTLQLILAGTEPYDGHPWLNYQPVGFTFLPKSDNSKVMNLKIWDLNSKESFQLFDKHVLIFNIYSPIATVGEVYDEEQERWVFIDEDQKSYLFFTAYTEDSNQDGIIDLKDNRQLYMLDLKTLEVMLLQDRVLCSTFSRRNKLWNITYFDETESGNIRRIGTFDFNSDQYKTQQIVDETR